MGDPPGPARSCPPGYRGPCHGRPRRGRRRHRAPGPRLPPPSSRGGRDSHSRQRSGDDGRGGPAPTTALTVKSEGPGTSSPCRSPVPTAALLRAERTCPLDPSHLVADLGLRSTGAASEPGRHFPMTAGPGPNSNKDRSRTRTGAEQRPGHRGSGRSLVRTRPPCPRRPSAVSRALPRDISPPVRRCTIMRSG
jgi:hypothetical protein